MAAKKLVKQAAEPAPLIDLEHQMPYTIAEFADILKVGQKQAERIIREDKIETCLVRGKRRIARKVAHDYVRANSEGDLGF